MTLVLSSEMKPGKVAFTTAGYALVRVDSGKVQLLSGATIGPLPAPLQLPFAPTVTTEFNPQIAVAASGEV